MRLLCPHCQKAIVLPDSEAGKPVTCPLCAQSFQAPTLAVETPPSSPPPPPIPASPPPIPASPPPIPAQTSPTLPPVSPPPIPVQTSPPPIPVSPPPIPVSSPMGQTQSTPTLPPVSPPPVPPAAPSAAPMNPVSSAVETFTQAITTAAKAAEKAVRPPEGYEKLRSIAIRVEWVRWLPAIALGLALILTFFKWAGLYPGGYAAYTQNGWQALGAGLSVDPVCEKKFTLEKPIKEKLKSDWWLLFYFILLIPGVALAWLGHFQSAVDKLLTKYPKAGRLWRHRPAVLLGFTSITCLLLLVQYANGFGVQRVWEAKQQETFGKLREEAKTPEEKQLVELDIALRENAFQAETTTALKLSIFVHLLALIGLFGDTVLTRRGERAPPRVGVMW